MGTITATAQQDKGRVRLDIDWTSHPSPRCRVFRCFPGAIPPAPVLIREGAPCVLSNNKATIYDWEGPLDTPTYYQAVVQLNDNADMEASVEEWQSTNTTGGVATQSDDYFYAGSASLKFTPTGSAAAPQVLSEQFAVTVGTSYTATAQLLAAATWTGGIGIIINWYTSGLVYLSTTGSASDLWPTVGDWESYTVTGTAPATAAFARFGFLLAGTPPAANVFYIDEAYATTPLGTIDTSATPIVLASAAGGWWKDPLRPATAVKLLDDLTSVYYKFPYGELVESGLAIVGVSRPNHPADAALLEVPSQALGIGSFSTRKGARRSVQVASGTFADADALRSLHAGGAPLLLQLPARFGIPEEYSLCADLDSTALGPDMNRQFQIHTVQATHVASPAGPAEGVAGCRYADLRVKGAKLTYAAATSAGYTWLDALKGNIS